MAEPQLTGLQKRAEKYLNRVIAFQKMPGETVRGHFTGFDESSADRAVLQLSNAADKMTVPLMYVVTYCEEMDEAKRETIRDLNQEKRPEFKLKRS
jgi:hypothetical protein